MSSVVDLIVLASSAKNSERCIAGIDTDSGEWIRPVGPSGHGEVPFSLRNINGKEPGILDIVRMELDSSAETHGFQMENRSIVAKPWRLVRKATAQDVLPYRCRDSHVFFEGGAHIRHSDLVNDGARRSSLQLWGVSDFRCFEDTNIRGVSRWKGWFTVPGGQSYSLVIKDLDYEAQLNEGHRPSGYALLLVSLGVPFTPETWTEAHCWKLIATVIEL